MFDSTGAPLEFTPDEFTKSEVLPADFLADVRQAGAVSYHGHIDRDLAFMVRLSQRVFNLSVFLMRGLWALAEESTLPGQTVEDRLLEMLKIANQKRSVKRG
jgi:hypothetical protein